MNLVLCTLSLLAVSAEELETGSIEAIKLMIIGMGTVFFALIMIFFLLTILNRMSRREAETKAAATAALAAAMPAPAPKPVAEPAQSDIIAPEILVALTAAVAATVRRPFRIQRVQLISQASGNPWGEHGRSSIHRSHRLQKGNQ